MDVFNQVVSFVGDKINLILSFVCIFLPDSPFSLLDSSPVGEYLGYINYFVPIDFMVDTLSAWTAAILVYYCVQILLRWIKAAASS